MQNIFESINFDYYTELILKHRWIIILSFCLALIVGLYLTFTIPRKYECSTFILVEPQRVPKDYVRSIITMDLGTRISAISDQILSRTNLEKIIEKYNLFSNPTDKNMFMEKKVELLRRRIIVSVGRSNRGQQSFSVSVSGKDPEKITDIANTLAGVFIEENLRVRESQALGTDQFLNDQLVSVRNRLETVENQIRDYRKKHMGEMPEQLDANLKMLETLQIQVNERKKNLQDAKNRLMLIEKQIDADSRLQSQVGNGMAENEQPLTIDQLIAELNNLKANYTDKHPDVVRLKRRIADLESKDNIGFHGAGEDNPAEPKKSIPSFTSMFQRSNIRQREEIQLEIRDIKKEIPDLLSQIKEYERRIEATPKREEEVLTLDRDYSNIKQQYYSILNRKLEAEMAVNMEKRQKGEQFRILDPARVPERPVSPVPERMLMMSLFLGLVVGLGIIVLIDLFNTSFKKAEEIIEEFKIPVLATIPRLYQPKDLRRKKVYNIFTGLGVAIALSLLAIFTITVSKGIDPTIHTIQNYINFPIEDISSKLFGWKIFLNDTNIIKTH